MAANRSVGSVSVEAQWKKVSFMKVLAILVAALALSAADKKHKGPDVELLDVGAKRGESLVTVDCRVRNIGEKPIRGLTLIFEFFGPGRVPITTQKATVDEESLAVREESTVRAQLSDPVRAVTFEISAVDEAGRDLKVAKPGAYSIE